MLSIVVSTITFFVASFYLKRYLKTMDLPQGMTGNILVFTIALAIAYTVALVVDLLVR